MDILGIQMGNYFTTKDYGPDTEELLRRIKTIGNGILSVTDLNITSLPELPPTVKHLWCYRVPLTSLPKLPSNLIRLDCSGTNITSLPELPSSLMHLSCSHTSLKGLPVLPSGLRTLGCTSTSITSLPELPPTLVELWCNNTPLTRLPELPSGLQLLYCNCTQITELPELPPSLENLYTINTPLILRRDYEKESIQDYNLRWRVWREVEASKKRSQERCEAVKEDLMATAWHPKRVEQWLSAGVDLEAL
jgi:Leucine-rich repeat (LRR) protein